MRSIAPQKNQDAFLRANSNLSHTGAQPCLNLGTVNAFGGCCGHRTDVRALGGSSPVTRISKSYTERLIAGIQTMCQMLIFKGSSGTYLMAMLTLSGGLWNAAGGGCVCPQLCPHQHSVTTTVVLWTKRPPLKTQRYNPIICGDNAPWINIYMNTGVSYHSNTLTKTPSRH